MQIENSEHFFKCNLCEQLVDMRDLTQVIEHEHNDDLPVPTFSGSRRVGDNTEWLNGKKPININ